MSGYPSKTSTQKPVGGNLKLGVAAAVAAGIVGAIIWAAITAATHYQIGFMAIGLGFMVGFAMRFAGRGDTAVYGVCGAIIALAGCALGNLLAVCIMGANEAQIPVMEVFRGMTPRLAVDLMKAGFSPMDLVFYAIAGYEGFKFSLAPSE